MSSSFLIITAPCCTRPRCTHAPALFHNWNRSVGKRLSHRFEARPCRWAFSQSSLPILSPDVAMWVPAGREAIKRVGRGHKFKVIEADFNSFCHVCLKPDMWISCTIIKNSSGLFGLRVEKSSPIWSGSTFSFFYTYTFFSLFRIKLYLSWLLLPSSPAAVSLYLLVLML